MRYRHYKGGLYEDICIATHTETEEQMMIYRKIDGEDDSGFTEDGDGERTYTGKNFARPLTMFNESIMVNGVLVKRFASEPISDTAR
jgi:hypothetical protein